MFTNAIILAKSQNNLIFLCQAPHFKVYKGERIIVTFPDKREVLAEALDTADVYESSHDIYRVFMDYITAEIGYSIQPLPKVKAKLYEYTIEYEEGARDGTAD